MLNKITREFILNEGVAPTFQSWIQSLFENLHSLRPRTISDQRRIEQMKYQLVELRKITRRMQENISHLEEQVVLLQEDKNE